MISEKVKQEILDGAYAVSRDWVKCKYIGTNAFSNYVFAFYADNGKLLHVVEMQSEFNRNKDNEECEFDIVGLWKNHVEPFDLEKALAGAPVKLRNGDKAYVKFVMPEGYTGYYPLTGYMPDPDEEDGFDIESWTLEGKALASQNKCNNDIIGMWKEPIPVSKNIAVECPRKLKDPKNEMWFINECGVSKSSYGSEIDRDLFDDRVYFGSKEDALAWYRAMKNSMDQ